LYTPAGIGRPACPVFVLTGVTVPEIVFTTNAVPPVMATAAGEYPTGMPRPGRPVPAPIGTRGWARGFG
jgi:hypothetical protein